MPEASPATGTVLVVDDDLDVRETIRDLLIDEGMNVVTATDGQDALDRLHEGLTPNVILLDLWMPGVDGTQFINMQRREPALARIPVLVLSAGRDTKEQAEACG